MKNFLNKLFSDQNPLRLLYHKIKGILAALYYRYPADKMIIIGVTGTKGKSTTVNLITNVLNASGNKVGMASTINFQINERRWINDTKQTTLGHFELQKLLRDMVNAGCKYAVIEVSSHSVTQSRIHGINFDVGVFTNVTPEHIEYHGSFENYLNAKGDFFRKVSKDVRKIGVQKVLISNADDKNFQFFDQFVADRKMSYGLKYATVYADQIDKKPEGSSFVMHVPNNAIKIDMKLPGEFNIYNALAAATCALSLNIPIDAIKNGLEQSLLIPGRQESVKAGQSFSVIVDYAHTAESLEQVLSLYRRLTKGKLYVVFGATGGGRDKVKRPKMGEVANEYADYIVVSNDDPYEEDENEIIEQISRGIPRIEGKNFWKIPDRREAIRLSLNMAREGDCVVVAGKGSEEVIVLKGGPRPWNDKKVIEELLKREITVTL